jgi:hypothetical protein
MGEWAEALTTTEPGWGIGGDGAGLAWLTLLGGKGSHESLNS